MSNLLRNSSPSALTRDQAFAREKKRMAERGRLIRKARDLAAQGRGTDTEVAHVAPGEIVLPKAMQTPEVMAALTKIAAVRGVPLARLRVGDSRNNINPKTGAPEFDLSERDLASIGTALPNPGNSMWSGNPWSSMISNMDRWASSPINVGSTGGGQPGGGSGADGSAPYRYDGPEMEEITVTAPRATNRPNSGGNIPYSGDLVLPGGDTVNGNIERTRGEMRDYMERGRRIGGRLGRVPVVGPYVGPVGEKIGSSLGYLGSMARWVNRVRPGGEWDYKRPAPGAWGDYAGNYNYGATGSQFFSNDQLLRAAGLEQIFSGRYDPKNGVPWRDRNETDNRYFGDNADDREPIEGGAAYGRSGRRR